MTIDKKKHLLVPLNNPRQPSRWARLVVAVTRPPLLVLGFIIGNLYKLCFTWLDKRMARKNQERFAEDIRRHLSFLFAEYSASVVPNKGVPFPPSFDGAYVTVAVGPLRVQFCRGRGDFSVSVASEFAPQEWLDFRLVADGIAQWDISHTHSYPYSLENFEGVLRPRLGSLLQALSKDNFEATLQNAVRLHNESVDRYAAHLRGAGISPKIY